MRRHPGWPELAAKLRWTYLSDNQPCLSCGKRPRDDVDYPMSSPFDPAHLIPKQWLARYEHEEAVTDERLIVCLCRNCHSRHDQWFKRLPRELVPDEAWFAARQYEIEWKLEKEFPEVEAFCPTCRTDLDAEGFCGTCGHDSSHKDVA